jgi:hypothetical protein
VSRCRPAITKGLLEQAVAKDDSQHLASDPGLVPVGVAVPDAVFYDLTKVVAQLKGHRRPAADAETA